MRAKLTVTIVAALLALPAGAGAARAGTVASFDAPLGANAQAGAPRRAPGT